MNTHSTPTLAAVAPATTCSRSFLEMRWYDSQWKKWTEWEEVSGRDLREKYGCNPEEWKESCKTWIEVGGCYEYRIGTRTDVTEWEISYRENRQDRASREAGSGASTGSAVDDHRADSQS